MSIIWITLCIKTFTKHQRVSNNEQPPKIKRVLRPLHTVSHNVLQARYGFPSCFRVGSCRDRWGDMPLFFGYISSHYAFESRFIAAASSLVGRGGRSRSENSRNSRNKHRFGCLFTIIAQVNDCGYVTTAFNTECLRSKRDTRTCLRYTVIIVQMSC